MRLAVLLAAAGLGLAACATPTGPEAAARFDQFDGDAATVAGFEAVFVAPVTASDELTERIGYRPRGASDSTRTLGERELLEQQERLRESLEEALGRAADLRNAPGPGVLTVATEMTALNSNRPSFAELAASPGLDPRSISVGDAAVRVVLSEDGRELAVIEDRAFRRNLNEPGIGVGIWHVADQYYDRLGDKLAALLR